MLGMFGPAAIVASVAIGAGETIVVVRCGAWAGYHLLWLVALSVLVKGVFVTYMLGRYTAVSGEPVGQRLARLPGPRGWLLVALVVLELAAAPPLWAVVARPCGDLLYFLTTGGPTMQQDAGPEAKAKSSGATAGSPSSAEHGKPETLLDEPAVAPTDAVETQPHAAAPQQGLFAKRLLTTLFIGAALLISLLMTYERLERQQVAICGILVLGTAVGTLLVRPDLVAAFEGMLSVGYVPKFPAWAPASATEHTPLMLATTFGYVGGTVLGYIVYANWIGLHGWGMTGHRQIEEIRRRAAAGSPGDYLPTAPDEVAKVRRSINPLKWDVGAGAVVLLVVTGSFMMAGAAVLYPMLESGRLDRVFSGWSLLTDQAYIWRNIHPSLIWVYYVCVLAALWGTLQAFPEIYTRVIVEFGQTIWPTREWSFRRVQRWICLYVFASSAPVVWSGARFDTLTHIVAFLTTNLAVAIAMLGAIYLNFQLPRAYRTRWPILWGAIASAAILAAVSAVSGLGLLRELFG